MCWQLQLPKCQLGLQQNIPWWWEPSLLGNSQQPLTTVWPKGSSQFLHSLMERRHQSRSGFRECQPGQLTTGQTCFRKDPAVTTPALSHKATETQSSCPQRSGEALELSQSWLEVLLPSYRWIQLIDCHLWTQQTSRRHTSNFVRACYLGVNTASHVAVKELCFMLGQRVREHSSLLHPSPSG